MGKREENRHFWLAIINDLNLKIMKKENVIGFDEKLSKRLRGIKLGDSLIFYLLPKRLVGTYKFSSKQYLEDTELFIEDNSLRKRLYSLRYKIKRVKPFKIKEITPRLIGHMGFIKNKAHWGGSFQGKAIKQIEEKYYNKILRFLYEK